MKIRLFHRQPMPGSTRAILNEGTDEPYACQLEVDRLFDAVVRGWPQLLADAIIRLSDSRRISVRLRDRSSSHGCPMITKGTKVRPCTGFPSGHSRFRERLTARADGCTTVLTSSSRLRHSLPTVLQVCVVAMRCWVLSI